MKNRITLLFTLLITSLGWSQTPCDAGRYSSNVYASVNVTSDIQFGQNTTWSGNNYNLLLDFYEPVGDTATARPLIIWAHGGSFLGGTKTDGDVAALSQDFAEKGFACASINYRTGMWPIDSTNAVKAVIRAVQDMKAAIRFFYKDRATANTYKIDTNNIFIGGSSAGAITALHLAYLDQECEAEVYLSLSELNAMGGIEGDSGNPGYSTDVVGVINLCGALASYGYVEPNDVPLCSLHGNNDGIVPYNRGVATVSSFQIMYLDGSRMIDAQCNAIGVQSNLYNFYGQDHVPYASSQAYMDTTINFVRDFVIDVLGCSETPLQAENAPLENPNFYQLTYCGLGIDETAQLNDVKIYPNPAKDHLTIELNEESVYQVNLVDIRGRSIMNRSFSGSLISIEDLHCEPGVYFVHIENSSGVSATHQVVID